MSTIKFEVLETGIGLITIDRPGKRNALDDASMLALIEILEAPAMQELSAAVLVGAGKHFCAGVDLSEIGTSRHTASKPPGGRLFQAFRESGPVIIAAVHGYALGLGCGVAMAADLVVASDDSQFGYPAIAHGLVNGVTMVGLKEVVGARKSFEMLVTGRRVAADEALAIGMVNEVVPVDELRQRALEIARTIAGHRLLAVQTTKQFFYEASDLSFGAATRVGERVVQLIRKADQPERAVTLPTTGRKATT
jgi:enoyl-CoA hydratase